MSIRLSNNTIYSTGIYRLTSLQSGMDRLGNQVATGRKILSASDDPIAAARALEVSQSDAVNTQYEVNRQYANSSLTQAESVLDNATSLLHEVKALGVSAGNAAYSNEDRRSLAVELRGKLDDLLGLANTSDGAGSYLFSGYKSTTLPFVKTAEGARYDGAQGQRKLQVASAREVAITDSGAAIFENNRTGNGTFTVSAAAANAGSGVFSNGIVKDPAQLTRDGYEVRFAVDSAGVTTYDVVNTTTTATVSSGNAYKPGEPIEFDGQQFSVSGAPADGDVFEVKPSSTQSLFQTLTDMINIIERPLTVPGDRAKLQNGLVTADANLTSALDNMLTVRSQMGATLREMEYLDSAGSDLSLQYATTLSNLQSLDYNKALSELAQQQFTLEAAQKSYKMTSGMSLFNFIS